MNPTAVSRAPARTVWRPVQFPGDLSLSAIAAQHGCSSAAIALLFGYVVDDRFVTVLTSAARRLRGGDLILALNARSVRKPSSEELLLGLALGHRPHAAYMDQALLDHDEVLFCIEPPLQWIATTPNRLRSELGARTIAIPSR